jgi:hypothetical protein
MNDARATGPWAGPLRFEAGGVPYAGAYERVDVDEDTAVIGLYAQARALRGWAGVAADITRRPDGRLDADVRLSGDAGDDVRRALLAAVRERFAVAAGGSPADDPAWRRQLAVRAGIAVAVGVAAGLAGAAWDRRRRG